MIKPLPLPIPPPAVLQNKKAALRMACGLLVELNERVNAYARLNTTKRLPHRQTPRPTLKAIYISLIDYPLGLYSNPLANTEPMLHRADSLVSDCLGLIRTGYIFGVFTPGDYQELTQRLTLACSIVDEVYSIETRRPNPGKVGTRPNAGRATPETRVKAVQSAPGNGWNTLTTAKDVRPLLARQSDIQAALDEVATAIATNDIADVARLLGVLESYPFRPDKQTSLLFNCVDWHIEQARFFVCEILCKPFTRQLALPRIQKGLSSGLQVVEELLVLHVQ